MSEIRILTVRQPWAWAIMHGGKDVENRVRNIAGDYRGTVAIHAALTGANFDSKHPQLWPFDGRHVILGTVDLVDAHFGPFAETWDVAAQRNALCSPWAERDVWHLKLANPRPLRTPLPFKGALGLRRFNSTLLDGGFR
jgi:hypothetical protein